MLIILRKVPLYDGDQIVDGEYPQSQKFQVEDLMGARCFYCKFMLSYTQRKLVEDQYELSMVDMSYILRKDQLFLLRTIYYHKLEW